MPMNKATLGWLYFSTEPLNNPVDIQ